MSSEHYFTSRGHADRFFVVKVDDSGDIQSHEIEGFSDEKFTKVSAVYPHGFTSHPLKDANLWGFAQGGSRDRMLLFGGEHPDKRMKNLPTGASALYDSQGNVIRLFVDKNEWEGKDVPLNLFGFTTIKVQGKNDIAIGIDGGRWIRVRSSRVDLAIKSPTEEAPFKVITEGGPSEVVYARID